MYKDGLPNLTNLFRKVDGCTIKLGAKVKYICCKENKCDNKNTNEDGCGFVGSSIRGVNNTVTANNLDTFHVVTSVLIRIVNSKSRLTFSSLCVTLFTEFNYLIFISFVSVVILVFLNRFLTRHALESNYRFFGFIRVRKNLSRQSIENRRSTSTIFSGEVSTSIICKETKVNISSIVSTVWTQEVFNFFLLFLKFTFILVFWSIPTLTLHVFCEFELFLVFLVVFIWILVSTNVFLSILSVAVIQAFLLIEVITLLVPIIVIACTYVFFQVLTVPLILLFNSFHVCLKIFIHVKNIVSIS
mmetsp:Transcript_16654/g.25157  ORF Transcript_16654/g.25157 Transcript_16654/m.25157 type:complete len:301 (-) Transcript_16654:408-1310(-)